MSNKLLPCPFCGQQPTMIDYRETSDETGEVEGYAAVECYHGGDSNTAVLFHCDTLEEAIKLWNTRPFSPVTIIAGVAAEIMRCVTDHQSNLMKSDDLRKRIASAIFDPGATEGLKGDRDLKTWQTDAVMRALGVSIDRIAEGSDNG